MSETKKKKYSVNYYETYSGTYEIEATDETQAEQLLKEMIQNGKTQEPYVCENSWCEVSEICELPIYQVDITETYKRTVPVSARDAEDAYNKVDEMISDGKIDLPCDGDKYDYERNLFVNKMNVTNPALK